VLCTVNCWHLCACAFVLVLAHCVRSCCTGVLLLCCQSPTCCFLAAHSLASAAAYCHLFGRNLETGQPVAYDDAHWRRVIARLELSETQVCCCSAAPMKKRVVTYGSTHRPKKYEPPTLQCVVLYRACVHGCCCADGQSLRCSMLPAADY
jgi:hypothetical protein